MKKLFLTTLILLGGYFAHAQITVTDEDGQTYTIDGPNIQTDEKGNVIIKDSEGNEVIRVAQTTDTLLKNDSTAVKIGKWKISMQKDDGDNTSYSIGKEDEDDNHGDNHHVDVFNTDWFLFDMGYNTYLDAYHKVNVPGHPELEDIHGWGSFDVNLHIFRSRINIGRGFMNFNYGISLESHHYRYDQNFSILANADSLTVNAEDIDYDKNKFNMTYASIPILIGFETKPWDTDRSFRVMFGYDPGILWYGKTKHKLDGNSDTEKDNFNLAPFRHEVDFEIGYGDFNVYASYDVNGMFREGEGPELHPFSVGLVLRRGF